MAESERRGGPRVDVEFFAVELGEAGHYYRLVRNVSEDGLFFETPPGWTHDEDAQVVLLVPPSPETLAEAIEIVGTVVHADERGVGLKLLRVPPAARAWIRRLIEGNA